MTPFWWHQVIQAIFRGTRSQPEKYIIAGQIGVELMSTEGPVVEDFHARMALKQPEKIADLTLNHDVELIEPGRVFEVALFASTVSAVCLFDCVFLVLGGYCTSR